MFKSIPLLAFIWVFSISNGTSQTHIANSFDPAATEGHNQRKIVRDEDENIYVVYTDLIDQESSIKSLYFDRSTGEWTEPEIVTTGQSPTLAIDSSGIIYLVYLTNDSLAQVQVRQSFDFKIWSPNTEIYDYGYSHKLPVADVDRSGQLNIFYVRQKQSQETLLFTRYYATGNYATNVIFTKQSITDVACANNLIYGNDELFYAIQYNGDSLNFMEIPLEYPKFNSLYKTNGTSPCITFNSAYYNHHDERSVRFLYIGENSTLEEFDYSMYGSGSNFQNYDLGIKNVGQICINNLIQPFGFSFLYTQNDTLFHAFSYGGYDWNEDYILSKSERPVIHPNIAYKHFNFEYVDYIWMEPVLTGYQIFHKREHKVDPMTTEETDSKNTLEIKGYPNPFSDILHIEVTSAFQVKKPEIEIYNSNSQCIMTLQPSRQNESVYYFEWDGKAHYSDQSKHNVYVLLFKFDQFRTARKVVLSNQ